MKSCFYRDIHILMICFQCDLSRFAVRNVCKTYCTARAFAGFFIWLPAIVAVYRINCFFSGLSTADQYRLVSVFKFCFQNCIQLCFKLIEGATIIFCYTDRFVDFFAVFPYRRILFRSGEIFALSCRLRILFIILCHPALI